MNHVMAAESEHIQSEYGVSVPHMWLWDHSQATSSYTYMAECRAVAVGSGIRHEVNIKHRQLQVQVHPFRSVTKVGRLSCSLTTFVLK